jgi:hypothetical protein
MKSKYKLIGGSLMGAVAIHLAFIACGHSLAVKGDADAGTEGGLLDALVDHISGLIDGTTKDARADVDGGVEGGACGCTVSVTGPIQNVPASENPAQLTRGNLTGLSAAGSLVVTGPFVLTDAVALAVNPGVAAAASLIVQPAAATCPTLSVAADTTPGYVSTVSVDYPAIAAIHGGRYAVPAGQMLCAYVIPSASNSWLGELQWAGFVPYS